MTDIGPTTLTMEAETARRSADDIVKSRQAVVVSERYGVLQPTNLQEALDLSQSMAKGESSVPAHLRGSPGACLAIIEYAASWGMLAYAVANQSYVVNDRLCFMSQLVHSVIKARAPLKYPRRGLKSEYVGAGDDMVCKVSAECYIDDERTVTEVLEWETPRFADIQPKNSPLWKSDRRQQMFYRACFLWQRRYFPEILLGIYAKEEIEDMPEEERAELAKDVTPKGTGLVQRLAGAQGGEGFRPDNFDKGVNGRDTHMADELANVASEAGGDVAPAKPAQEARTEAPGQAATETAPAADAAQAPARRKAPAKKKGGEADAATQDPPLSTASATAASAPAADPSQAPAPPSAATSSDPVPEAAAARPTEPSLSAPPAASTGTSLPPDAPAPAQSSTPATQAAPAPAKVAPSLPDNPAGYIAYLTARLEEFQDKVSAVAWINSDEQRALRKACDVKDTPERAWFSEYTRVRGEVFKAKGW